MALSSNQCDGLLRLFMANKNNANFGNIGTRSKPHYTLELSWLLFSHIYLQGVKLSLKWLRVLLHFSDDANNIMSVMTSNVGEVRKQVLFTRACSIMLV